MKKFELAVQERTETGKGPNRRLRAEGSIPAVIYGLGENHSVSFSSRDFLKLLGNPDGINVLVEIKGKKMDKMAVIKEIQRDPVKEKLTHVDFMEIDMNKAIRVSVPVHLHGTAPGIKEGGTLEQSLWHIEIESLPAMLPSHVEADVSSLHLNDVVTIKEMKIPEGVKVLEDMDATVVHVKTPRAVEETEAAEVENAEPEVITARKPSEEEEE